MNLTLCEMFNNLKQMLAITLIMKTLECEIVNCEVADLVTKIDRSTDKHPSTNKQHMEHPLHPTTAGCWHWNILLSQAVVIIPAGNGNYKCKLSRIMHTRLLGKLAVLLQEMTTYIPKPINGHFSNTWIKQTSKTLFIKGKTFLKFHLWDVVFVLIWQKINVKV